MEKASQRGSLRPFFPSGRMMRRAELSHGRLIVLGVFFEVCAIVLFFLEVVMAGPLFDRSCMFVPAANMTTDPGALALRTDADRDAHLRTGRIEAMPPTDRGYDVDEDDTLSLHEVVEVLAFIGEGR